MFKDNSGVIHGMLQVPWLSVSDRDTEGSCCVLVSFPNAAQSE